MWFGPVRWGHLRPDQFLDHLTVIIILYCWQSSRGDILRKTLMTEVWTCIYAFSIFNCILCRVAEVARSHEGPSPESFDSDENLRPNIRYFVAILRFNAKIQIRAWRKFCGHFCVCWERLPTSATLILCSRLTPELCPKHFIQLCPAWVNPLTKHLWKSTNYIYIVYHIHHMSKAGQYQTSPLKRNKKGTF